MPGAHWVYKMLGNENLWQVAEDCHKALAAANVPYTVCGGVAVCLHGYQRNTVDLDLIVRSADSRTIRSALEQLGLEWDQTRAEFRTTTGIAVQFLYAGEPAGNGSEVRLPEPEGEVNVEIVEGIPVLRLSKLIEIKIACGTGNIRRTHKDLADVVELIVVRKLDGRFTRYLHPSVRSTFRELLRNARGQS